jgi:predicted aspartyl protease
MFLHFLSRVLIGVTEMGLAWVDAVIKSPFTDRAVAVKALVDTGATLTVVPRKIAEELQLLVIGRRSVARLRGLQSLMSV